MSWDLYMVAAKSPPPPLDETSDESESVPLGSLEYVRDELSKIAPEIYWENASYGNLQHDDVSIEFDLGDGDPCTMVALQVRGGNTQSTLFQSIKGLADSHGWYVMDSAQGEWWHHVASPEEGLAEFNAYREESLSHVAWWRRIFWRKWF